MPKEGIGEVMEKEDCIQALSGQIFMGMVSSQYQARSDVVRLIEGLVNACIRFVYFSLEDELKSKVFAEKMGLETGWNCHISLTSNGDVPGSEIPHSSPSHAGSLHDDLPQASREDAEGILLMEEEGHSDLISFQPTDSDIPSQTSTGNPPAMCEMIKIMQEYGEVTCCLGSSANLRNNCLFLQSDISIALDPLYPSRCSWETFGYATSTNLTHISDELTPLQLSGQLNSLSCSLSICPEETIGIIRLIEQARHATYGIRKCFLFLLQCQLTLVIIQFSITICSCLACFGYFLQDYCANFNSSAFSVNVTGCFSLVLQRLLGQIVQTFLDLKLWVNLESPVTYQMDDIPMASWLLGLLSLVLVVIINETVKLHEIRVRVRYQKRQKLQFETKLGMNSPF
ncbi:hypothetical protein Chor_012122 [Crotalus horridus]